MSKKKPPKVSKKRPLPVLRQTAGFVLTDVRERQWGLNVNKKSREIVDKVQRGSESFTGYPDNLRPSYPYQG